jgi:ubiquinone/menaquinone biosynthesis C-methylase UbiE
MSIAEAGLKKEDVVKVYSGVAPVYDLWGCLTETRARQRSLQLAQIKNGEAILEVASGTGMTFREILKANPDGRNVGVDITPAMLEKARLKATKTGLGNYQLLIGDAFDLEFPPGAFDLVMNNYMFDLLQEKDFVPVLSQFKRVLKPSGRIILVNMTRAEHFYQRFWETVYHVNPAWLGGCRGVSLVHAMQMAGFVNILRETTSQFGFPSEIISANNSLLPSP